jgi:putative flippase GtrA
VLRLAAHNWRIDRGTKTFLRFATVGAITTALDVSLFAGLTGAAVPAPLANLSSYSCGILLSYNLNRSWTFRVDENRLKALKFVMSTLTGLLISTFLVAVLSMTIPATYAKLISVPVVFAWNYLTARLWVFSTDENPKGSKDGWFS